MPYVEDENGNHITDKNGNKLEYTVSYKKIDFVYVHREPIHVNSEGHLDTEDRNIKVKDATHGSHAVSKNQLDILDTQIKNDITTVINNLQSQFNTMIQQAVNNLKSEITTQLQTSMKTHEAKILTQMLNFRNEQIKDRVGRNSLFIERTNYKWIPILLSKEIRGIQTLQDVVILGIYLRRNDRFHDCIRSDLVLNSFTQLETFYNKDLSGLHVYFNAHPSNWVMELFLE